jgi:hypothetical protein
MLQPASLKTGFCILKSLLQGEAPPIAAVVR